MKNFSRLCLLLIVLLFLSFAARAQAPISEEKRKLISQLVVLMKMDTQSNKLVNEILKSMDGGYRSGFNATVDNMKELSPEQKDLLKETVGERLDAFNRKFRERLEQAVDFGKFFEEALYPLYNKFYTEQELRDLVAFYGTPTGQKVIDTMPQLYADASKMGQEKLLPIVLPLIKQISEEEKKDWENSAKKLNSGGASSPAESKPAN